MAWEHFGPDCENMMKRPCPQEACHHNTRHPSQMHQNLPEAREGRAGFPRNMRPLLPLPHTALTPLPLTWREDKEDLPLVAWGTWPWDLRVQLWPRVHSPPPGRYRWLRNTPPPLSHHQFHVQNFTVVLAEEPRKIFNKIPVTSLPC